MQAWWVFWVGFGVPNAHDHMEKNMARSAEVADAVPVVWDPQRGQLGAGALLTLSGYFVPNRDRFSQIGTGSKSGRSKSGTVCRIGPHLSLPGLMRFDAHWLAARWEGARGHPPRAAPAPRRTRRTLHAAPTPRPRRAQGTAQVQHDVS